MKRHRLKQRQHPIFSPVAILSTLVLMTFIGLGIIVKGGRAFSPGELSALNNGSQALDGFNTHADFADDCLRCHEPFRGIPAERCEACHKAIAAERLLSSGVHGKIETVEKCGRCHIDHRGNESDLLTMARTYFDHEATRFSLALHRFDYGGGTIHCSGCHSGESDFLALSQYCMSCHEASDPDFMAIHIEAYSDACMNCHDGLDTMAEFTAEEHANYFPLSGAHAKISCESCHNGSTFIDLSQNCADCHPEPTVHKGLFEPDCAACHTSDGWTPVSLDGVPFDHSLTRFSLTRHMVDFDGSELSCLSCHGAGDFSFSEDQCVDCHTPAQPDFMPGHIAAAGEACFNCHDGSGDLAGFDHDAIWPLAGQHQAASCIDCHTNPVTGDTSRDCIECHQEPEIHFGLFGTDCAACHTAEGWTPARLIRHSFPLNHGSDQEVPCTTCHLGTYAEYTCYECHEHEPRDIEEEHREENIFPPELSECVQCHPTGREEESERD